MATTEDRLQEVKELEELEELYSRPPHVVAERGNSAKDWYRRLLFGWVIVFGSILLFEPAPSNPDAAVPAWATVLATAFTVALVAAFVGLSRRRPWALGASVVAGGLGVAIGAACMGTDHHAGLWGAYELVAFSGLTAASWVAARR